MHSEYTALMSLALDHEATPEQCARLQEHVRGCGSCSAIWSQWQALDHQFSASPAMPAPGLMGAAVLARLGARSRAHSQRKWLASGFVLAWGATLCVLWITMLGLVWWGYRHPVEASLMLSSGAQIAGSLTAGVRGALGPLSALGREASLAVVGAGFMSITALGVMVWVWVMMRSQVWRANPRAAHPEQVNSSEMLTAAGR